MKNKNERLEHAYANGVVDGVNELFEQLLQIQKDCIHEKDQLFMDKLLVMLHDWIQSEVYDRFISIEEDCEALGEAVYEAEHKVDQRVLDYNGLDNWFLDEDGNDPKSKQRRIIL